MTGLSTDSECCRADRKSSRSAKTCTVYLCWSIYLLPSIDPAAPGNVVAEMRALLKETVLEEGLGRDLGISKDMAEFYSLKGPFIGMSTCEHA